MGSKKDQMKALVTGGNGFLGGWIVDKLLARGAQVRALVRRDCPELLNKGVELIKADLRNREQTINACRDIEVVFHAASKLDHWGKWKDFEATNIMGTSHIIEGCRKHHVAKLIYTSTPSVIFNGSDLCNVDETYPYPPKYHSHYAASKATAERMVISSNNRELITVALRPHLIWGPGDNHLIPAILKEAAKGRLSMIGNRKVMVDFSYVENVAHAHLAAADHMGDNPKIGGQVYFITQGEPVYLWHFINGLLRLHGIPPVTRRLPVGAARTLAIASEAIYKILPIKGKPVLTRFLVGQLTRSHYFNITKAVDDLGYQPRVSMAEGLEKTAQYFKIFGQ